MRHGVSELRAPVVSIGSSRLIRRSCNKHCRLSVETSGSLTVVQNFSVCAGNHRGGLWLKAFWCNSPQSCIFHFQHAEPFSAVYASGQFGGDGTLSRHDSEQGHVRPHCAARFVGDGSQIGARVRSTTDRSVGIARYRCESIEVRSNGGR